MYPSVTSLNIRQEPDLNAAIVGHYTWGEAVKVIHLQNGWAQTEKGWVVVQYLSQDKPKKKPPVAPSGKNSNKEVQVPRKISSCVKVDLGTIRDDEIVTAKKLHQIIQYKPGRDVYIVTYISFAGPLEDHGTLMYLPEYQELGLAVRSEMPDYREEFWRIWPNIRPEDFEEGLPYGEHSRPSISDISAPGPFPLDPVLTMVRRLENVETP